MRRKTLNLGAMLLLAAATVAPAQQVIDDKTPASRTQRIVLVGDSTMNHSSGWGGAFCDDIADDVECFNMARNGRSSKNYRAEGFWARALALKPTYMLIGFGGNDVPGKGPERETDPNTTFYANMKGYVDDARAAGVVPILVTPMEVRKYDKAGKLTHTYDDYAAATRKVGEDTRTPVIDLYALTTKYLETLTQAQADELNHVDPTAPKVIDRAHMNRRGSEIVGGMVAEQLAIVEPKLAKAVRVQSTTEDAKKFEGMK
jgi:lysophospholipase L1-like esterase